jgi:tRNA threonylcarbamoyl adenosine modification protein (Sua5/YciO/YrdC/YwlC family)
LQSLNDPLLTDLFASGKVGVIPTDTIYGLAAAAGDVEATKKLGRLKQGEENYKPGTVIAASPDQLIRFGVDAQAVRRVQHLWPSPLSIELPAGENLNHLSFDGHPRAFRVVADGPLRDLLEKTGPLLTTSANLHGEPPADNIQQAQRYFGGEVDFYLDNGDLSGHPPSTVVRLVDGRFVVMRQGAIAIDENGNIV